MATAAKKQGARGKGTVKRATPLEDNGLAIRPVGARMKLNMLVYAPPGAGKTPFIGTSERALILDADNAETSLALHGSKAKVVTIEDYRKMSDVLQYLQHEKHGFKWVWLDGITLYQEKGLEEVMEELVARNPRRDVHSPDRGEYKQNYARILTWVRHMAALPINFGITAHLHFDEDYEMHVPLIAGRSASSGPMWMKVCGYMGVVAYLRKTTNEKRGEHWMLHTNDYKDYYGKSWFKGLNELRAPTVPMIDEIVADQLQRSKPPQKKSARRRRRP